MQYLALLKNDVILQRIIKKRANTARYKKTMQNMTAHYVQKRCNIQRIIKNDAYYSAL
jgi:hypothetical protein